MVGIPAVVVVGMNALGDQSAEMAAVVWDVPIIGEDIGEGLSAAVAEPLKRSEESQTEQMILFLITKNFCKDQITVDITG